MTRTIPSTRVLLRIAAVACVVLAPSAVARAQTVDPTFDPGVSGQAVYCLVFQPDGKILVGGFFTGLGGGTGTTPRNNLGRVNADGSIDESFDPAPNYTIFALVLQPDGKILVGGEFTEFLGQGVRTPRNHLARLNADGTVDESFNPGANATVWHMALQPDGKIIVAGEFTGLGGGTGTTPQPYLGRLNADGSLDESFTPASPDQRVRLLALQADGKILVGGEFDHLGAEVSNQFGRLHSDGSLDVDFSAARDWTFTTADNDVHAIAMQADGKIVLGLRQGVLRVNPNGSLDKTFRVDTALYLNHAYVKALVVQPNGRIVAGGWFAAMGRQDSTMYPRLNLARLMEDGSIDHSFNPGTKGLFWYEPPSRVQSVVEQPDGRLLVGGHFIGLGGGTGTTPRLMLGRLLADTTDAPFVALHPSNQTVVAGTSATFHCEGFGFPEPTVQWIVRTGDGDWVDAPGATATTFTYTFTATLADDGKQFRAVFSNTLGVAMSDVAVLSVALPVAPVVTTHPVNRTAMAGTATSFSAEASGSPAPTVRWQESTTGGTSWNDIASATATSYSLTPALADNGKWFRAVFTNIAGEAASNPASLTVTPPEPPSITTHPSNRTARAGTGASFSAAATGTPPPTVQWQASADNGGTWTNIAGATGTSYAVTATAASNGSHFRARFTNIGGTATTTAAELTVRSVSGSDFDGNATTDIAVYRRTTGVWYIGNDQWVQYGGPGHVPVAGDYNGDGTTDIALYAPATGFWYVQGQFWTQFGDAGDIPVPGDYDGDGTTNLAVYRPSTGGWYVRNQLGIVGFGGPDYIPVVADYDGNGTTDIAVYRPSTGFWYVRSRFAIQFGAPGVVPVPSDYNGDGAADLAVYQPSTGQWSVRNQFTVQFGSPGDVPLARDFDGNGTSDVAVYRPSTGHWLVRNQFAVQFGDAMDVPVPRTALTLAALNGDYDADRVTNLAVYTASTGLWRVRNGLQVAFGEPSDKPVPADYDGDGLMDVAVYRPSTGTWFVRDQFTVQFGDSGDIVVPGDYDGDGLAEVAVYRPSTGFWYFHNQPSVHFGDTGDIPVPGDYNGDGRIDIAVYRPSTGYWYVRNQMAVQFGAAGTVPVPGDYNGDGVTDFAVFNAATGAWNVRGQFTGVFGDGTDTPVPGDYDGDGATDIAVYRPSSGEWIVRNQFTIVFGDPGDVPVVRIGGNH